MLTRSPLTDPTTQTVSFNAIRQKKTPRGKLQVGNKILKESQRKKSKKVMTLTLFKISDLN